VPVVTGRPLLNPFYRYPPWRRATNDTFSIIGIFPDCSLEETTMAQNETPNLPGAPFGREARDSSGEWQPLFDWFDVYAGNRWKDRHGQFGLFDSPSGIRLSVEEASTSEVLFNEDADWEGGMLPLYVWQEDGQYKMLYRASGGTGYRYSEDGYRWTRPEIGRIDFNDSKKNNLVCDQCVGMVTEDPLGPPDERFKSWVEIGGMFDPDTGEELDGEEGLKRMGDMEYAGDSYAGPPMVLRAYVRGFTSPDLMHWKQIDKPVANMPSDGSGSYPMFEPETETYFSYIRVHGLAHEEIRGLAHSTPELDYTRRCVGIYADQRLLQLAATEARAFSGRLRWAPGIVLRWLLLSLPRSQGVTLHAGAHLRPDQRSRGQSDRLQSRRSHLEPAGTAPLHSGWGTGQWLRRHGLRPGRPGKAPGRPLGSPVHRRIRPAQRLPSRHADAAGTEADPLGTVATPSPMRHRSRKRRAFYRADAQATPQRAAAELQL
jgi:hypothetical protein